MSHEAMIKTLDWFESVGVNRWNFSVLDGGMIGHDRPRDRAEVLKSCGWGWVRNRDSKDVYLRPARGSEWPVVFLDDITLEVGSAIAKKYAALIIETSEKNCQAWIATSRPLADQERGSVQRHLVSMVGGDPASADGVHFGRAPGFRNRKKGRNDWLVSVVTVTEGQRLDPTPYLTPSTVVPLPTGGGCALTGLRPSAKEATSPQSSTSSSVSSESEKEYRYCLSRFAWAVSRGRDPSAEVDYLVGNLADRVADRHKRGIGSRAHAIKYATRTVQGAFARFSHMPQSHVRRS